MKILVTGSNGLLGQKLTEQLVTEDDTELIATSRGADRYPRPGGYIYEELDICDADAVEHVIRRHRPDVVINTAAMTNVDACERDPEGCRRLNVDAVQTLAGLCTTDGIHFIHLSTDFIFDGKNGPYKEDDVPNPLSLYGESKLDAEQVTRAAGGKWTILRTILVYGVVSDMSRSNIVLWAKGALEKGQPLSVVDDQWRMPTLAEDLAAACISAAQKGAEGIFHISGKDMFSIYELVEAVADFWKLDTSGMKRVSSATLSQDAPRPARTGFILDKAYDELDYRPHSFREGLGLVDRQLKAGV